MRRSTSCCEVAVSVGNFKEGTKKAVRLGRIGTVAIQLELDRLGVPWWTSPMPKASKISSSSKINKSAWIRSQPSSMSAKDVFAKAKEEGIKLSIAQVYTARSTAKKAGKAKANGKPGRPKRTLRTDVSADLSSIKRAVFQHGFAQVEAFLADLKKSVGF